MAVTTFTLPYVGTPPYFSGTAASTLVPNIFPVAIDGRPYMVDQKSGLFQRNYEQRIRDSQDISTAPGESSINPGGLWRRGQDSWHYGAGQQYADAAESKDYRFYKSKGINPWVKGQLSLLNDTKLSLASTATSSHMVVQDGRVYLSTNGDIRYTTDPYASSPTWSNCTGEPSGKTCTAMATNGDRIYLGFTTSGVRYIDPAVSVSDASNILINTSETYYMLGFAKGFMFGAYDHVLYNINSSGSKSAIITPVDTGFTWTGVATGQNAIYAAGYANKKSYIYKITIKADGTLDSGVVALELPTGETATAISGYLGFIILGTNKGVRYCTTDTESNLIAGPIIPTSGPVKKITSEGNFSYFTWSNYDGVSTGLGCLNLQYFSSTNAPAFATDLMYTSTADVLNVVTFDNKRCFFVSGVGVVVEDSANLVTSGSIETGTWRWGIPDRKFVAKVDTRATPLVGSIKQYMNLDDGGYVQLGTWASVGDTENTTDGSDSHTIEASFKFELLRDTTTTSTGPTMTRWMARAYVSPFRSQEFIIPIIMHRTVVVRDKEYYYDVEEQQSFFDSLIESPRIVTLQIGNFTHTVIVDDVKWAANDAHGNAWVFEGTLVVTLRSVEN